MICEFNEAFGRPVNFNPTTPSVTDRLLLGNLLLEETLEYIEKGLGLTLALNNDMEAGDSHIMNGAEYVEVNESIGPKVALVHKEGDRYDLKEAADGLGDVNVIIHFNALWEGIPLAAVTNEIHRSNMSKLGKDGKPIINGVTVGYREAAVIDPEETTLWNRDFSGERGYDPTKPVGKILKGPNYSPPNLLPILGITPEDEEK